MRVRHRVGDLEIEEDVGYQRAEWVAQRIGWLIMAVVVVAAALGFAGTGPVSHRTSATADGVLEIRYERFVRRNAPALLRVQVAAGHDAVWIGQSFLGQIRLVSMEPAPATAAPAGDRVTYRFDAGRAEGGFDLVIRFEPEAIGGSEGVVGVPGADSLSFRQFVYP